MRLDKYIKHALCISRSGAVSYIKNKDVLVNNEAKRNDYEVKDGDIVTYKGRVVKYKEYYYYMLNKPAGYICSLSNTEGMPVTSIIKERNDLVPIGRLDKDTEGLLILTNDGNFVHHLTSPKHDIEKGYYVKSEKEVTSSDIENIKKGVTIKVDGNDYLCKGARAIGLSADESIIYIKEGKFHQVKEMYKAIGNKVLYLKRLSIGNLKLDEKLNIGKYRELTNEEVEDLKGC